MQNLSKLSTKRNPLLSCYTQPGTYLDTWNGFEAAETAPWLSRAPLW